MNTLPAKSVALMQPYFFPYLGYYQLLNYVDEFILYDDVQYMKGGWINRNRILQNGKPVYITLPVQRGSISDTIANKCIFTKGRDRTVRKLLKRISACYESAPFFDTVFPFLADIIENKTDNLAEYLEFSIREVSSFLNITTPIIVSSSLEKNDINISGQDRVLCICKNRDATMYVNAIGGKSIYDNKLFKENKIRLHFLKPTMVPYTQHANDFVSHLSLIDVLMFNSINSITDKLLEFDLV